MVGVLISTHLRKPPPPLVLAAAPEITKMIQQGSLTTGNLVEAFSCILEYHLEGVCDYIKEMPTILEPIAAGILVALFNKYILGRLDPLAACSTLCTKKTDDDDCTSSSSTTCNADVGHIHMHY